MNLNWISYSILIAIIMVCRFVKCLPYNGFNSVQQLPNEVYELEYGNVYESPQLQVAKASGRIKPIVDVTREEEKYGNDGGVTRNLLNSFSIFAQGTSSAISKGLGKPSENRINLIAGFYPLFINIGNRIAGLA